MNRRAVSKKLREIERLKRLSSLSHEEEEKLKKESFYKDAICKLRKKTINDLPEDVEFIIMSYLPPKLRLMLLKQKYSHKFLAHKLHNAPKDFSTLQRLHSLVGQCKDVLKKYLDRQGDIYKNANWYIDLSQKDLMKPLPKHCEFLYYEKLSYIIMAAIQNYSKMYKKTEDTNEHFKVEKQILGLYVHVINL